MRLFFLLLVGLFASSCVRPSCIVRSFATPPPNLEHFATINVYSKPIPEAARRYSTGLALWGQFESGAMITIDSAGGMKVMEGSYWPRHCATIPQEEIAELSGEVQPVLNRLGRPRGFFEALENPSGNRDDWRPDGPILDISFGSAYGTHLGVYWDGRARLPAPIEHVVMQSLEIVCANSGLARRFLLRDLPPEVSRRLACR